MEIWKPVIGFEGSYEVSQLGNVRSIDRKRTYKDGRVACFKGKALKPVLNGDGYLQVQLNMAQKTKTMRVHRMVAEAFIPNDGNLPEVNHKDENKLNNSVRNLEWCDHLYNSRYGTRGERISRRHSHTVVAYLPGDPGAAMCFDSMKTAATHFRVSHETIRQAIKYGWKCRGHILVRG